MGYTIRLIDRRIVICFFLFLILINCKNILDQMKNPGEWLY